MRNARGTLRCRRGAYSLEFAKLTPIILGFMAAGVEMAWQASTSIALDHAALHASRVGSLGRRTPDGNRAGPACHSAIVLAARRAGHGLLNGNLDIRPKAFSSAMQAAMDQGGVDGPGLGGETVRYRLEYRQPYFFIGWFVGQEEHVHSTVAIIRNEPYANGAANAPPC